MKRFITLAAGVALLFVWLEVGAAQQASTLQIIRRVQSSGRAVIVGGPDATSSPHVYQHADVVIAGEAEVTLPQWLADLRAGRVQKRYEAGNQRADVTTSPLPRFPAMA